MLAHYYHLKELPVELSEASPTGLTTSKNQSTMRKAVLQFYLLLLLLTVGTINAFAQSVTVTVSSPTICLGDQLSLDASVTGGTPTQLQVDYNNDGTFETTIPNSGPNYNTSYIYPASGPYTIKVRATLSGGGNVEATTNVIVYRLPIPSAIVNGSAVQCFRGNLVTLNNTSVKTDNSIYRLEVLWGDGNRDVFPFPNVGLTTGHTYNASNQYSITIKVVDSVGCFKDTTYNGLITIKDNIGPSFDVFGTRGCDTSIYLFDNTTVISPTTNPLPFSMIRRYTWDFGDGTSETRQQPWILPQDSFNYDTIYHRYVKNGVFLPALIIEDITGCIDSFRIDRNSNKNKPENIVITFDAAPYLSVQDTIKRDSVCYDKEGFKTLVFKQTPNEMINPGNGELLWTFDDPPSQQQNFNTSLWTVPHNFQAPIRQGVFNVRLVLWPNQPNPKCRKDTILPIEVLGPRARIEDPQNNIVILPTDKNQCQANASGFYNTVDFVNTSQYYKSDHVFRLWDFGDNFAPQCTSFLVPNVGYPPLGGWATAADQYNFSTGYWRQGNKVFPGRRLDCRYSADTLPLHNYRDWNVIYQWYRYGHDFMPWDFNRYTRNPADTILPLAQGGKVWVQPWDTLYWGKPVYLNPVTGVWSLTQGTWTDPFSGQTMPWPRIDTIRSVDPNGQPNPNDLVPYNRFTLQNGAPDPLVGFYGNTLPSQGGYGFIPRGTVIDPIFDTLTLKYTSVDGRFYKHHYDSLIDQSPDRKTFYRYMFDRGVQACHTVRLFLKDSLNNVGNKSFLIPNDISVLDSLDCEHDNQVQLKLMRPDARGVGKRGVECPGAHSGPDQAGIQFMFGPVSDRLGDYPGISPDCGQSFIRFNHDSMADRLDQTPCALDGFVDFGGGTTPGGLTLPPFANQPDFGQFLPPNLWADPFGTSFWYQYGPGVASGWPLSVPANPTGDITIGIIVGTGDPTNPCLSDTIWYHNFLNITDLDGRFFVDPTYNPLTNAPTNGACKLYCKNDMVNFVYIDSTQRYLKSSMISWGDNSITVDSFYYGKPGQNDGYFVDGFRRVRYNIYYGPCGENILGSLIDSIVFPNGLPGANVTYEYIDNYTNRIYNASTNPFGSLTRIGPNTAGDSVQWQECGKTFWVANTDTIKKFYITVVNDRAKMLMPVQHKYWSSSYEDDCKRLGATPRAISHTLTSTKECKKFETDTKLLVRGVIDSVRTRNAKGEWDDIFCKNEPVYFYDSIRYWRPDCSLSDPIFNPNFNPITNAVYNAPFNSYHYDTIDYWRDGSIDINDFRPNGDYVEKVKYYFGDGDSAMWTKPVHKYKTAGRYLVTLLSRDKKGCWDTAQCVVFVTEPNAIPDIRPGLYNCGNPVTFYDRSTMTPIAGYPYNPFDSIRFLPAVGGSGKLVNRNYWFFGERQTDTLRADAQYIDTPVWNYRGNGSFRIKLVVETAQGCKDTGFVNLFISGPRPYLKVITDTVGCAPFTVKVINMADSFGGNDRPTKRTDILWGDKNSQQTSSLKLGDTLSFTYNDSGTFYIFARSDDNNPQSDNNGCKIVYFPDTTNGNNAPIRISVKRSYPAEIALDKQVVCVDQGFLITNKSDTISYTEFKYDIVDSAGALVNTITKTNTDNKFTQTLGSPGKYEIRLEPTKVAPGLPFCRLFDTLPITVVRPFASFVIDSGSMPKFKFINTSTSSSEYTWTATKNGNIVGQVDKVESDRDWSFDFGSDTGDVVICLEAFTPDPAKPACVDKVCDTISYRFVVEFEIYNVFTPNNDASNDKFDIKIKGETKYDLTIYNRWGTKVFESTDASYDWDGTNKNDGTACPQGTYFYVFKYELMNGEKKTLNGTVTLIRDANK